MRANRVQQLVFAAKQLDEFDLETQMLAVAFTLTEMEFRTFYHRLIEYIYVFLLLSMGKDASKVSVGVSQVSIRHYMSQEGIGQFSSLVRSFSLRSNLRACCLIISRESDRSLDNLCRVYNGSGTGYYRRLVAKSFEEAIAMSQAKEMRHR